MKIFTIEGWAEGKTCYDVTSKESQEQVLVPLFAYIMKEFFPNGLPDKVATLSEFIDSDIINYGEDFEETDPEFLNWKEFEEEERQIISEAFDAWNNKDFDVLMEKLCESDTIGFFDLSEVETDYKDPEFLKPFSDDLFDDDED